MEKPEYRYLNEKRLNGAWYALYDLQFSPLVEGHAAKVALQDARRIVAEVMILLRREDALAEDHSQCHDHVAGRQGEGR